MLGPTVTDACMLYSPTPMKRRSGNKSKKGKSSSRRVENGEISPDQESIQDSVSSKLSTTVGTVATAQMGDSDSDSDCDERSFFSDAFSAISELPDPEETLSPQKSDLEDSPKKRKNKKKKKKDKSLKSPKSPKSPKKKKKSKKEKTPKSEKSKKKSVKSKKKSKSEKPKKSSKSRKSKEETEDMFGDSDSEDSFLGDSFHGTHLVEARIQQQEEAEEDFPGGPPLWGETDEEKSYADEWVEDKSWDGWQGNDDKSEYVEETICDDHSHDGFSYYTIHSNEDREMDLDMGFPDNEDIEDDDVTELTERSERSVSDKRTASEKKRVTFNEAETIHETLHIADFSKKEIKRSWYQQKDYEETIEGVKQVANNSETPRDTQTRLRRQRSLLSKTAETRGLEAWTPSGVQRFRYVKEAAFRAVWDEQQKHYNTGSYEDDESDISTVIENQEKLREAYERISQKSLSEAHLRAKKDAEIAARLTPRSIKKKVGRRGSWEKSMGSSSRSLLGSNHGLSDNPNAPTPCLRMQEGPISPCLSESEHGRRQLWFNDSSRGLARQKSDRSMSSVKKTDNRGLFSPNRSERSERSLFKKERGLFRQVSDRSLPAVFSKSKTPERGLFRQMSDRNGFKDKKEPERGLFRQISDRSLFKKKAGLSLFLNKETSERDNRSLFSQKSADFGSIAEEPDRKKKKPKRRSSDLGLSGFTKNTEKRSLERSRSLRM